MSRIDDESLRRQFDDYHRSRPDKETPPPTYWHTDIGPTPVLPEDLKLGDEVVVRKSVKTGYIIHVYKKLEVGGPIVSITGEESIKIVVDRVLPDSDQDLGKSFLGKEVKGDRGEIFRAAKK